MQTKKDKLKLYVTNNIDKIYRLAFSYVKNQQDAEDIVNESIKKALYSINSLKNEYYMSTWLYRIVVNTANSYLKSKSKIIYLDEQIEDSLIIEDTHQDTDLYNLVIELEPKYRIVIILKFYEDMTFEQIANILNENVNTIKTRLYKALNKLKIELCKEEDSDERIQI